MLNTNSLFRFNFVLIEAIFLLALLNLFSSLFPCSNKEWNWLRGALCTVDRSFGPLLDHTFHHIVDTHVCHHLFSKMPFYHAQEVRYLWCCI